MTAKPARGNSTRAHRCPVAAFQKLISGKYKLRIMWDLQDGPRRYGEIRTGLLRGDEATHEIAPRVLSRELKALVHSGLIARKDFGLVPPKVEYRLTPKGRSFVPVIAAIRDWGSRHLGTDAGTPARGRTKGSLPRPRRASPAPDVRAADYSRAGVVSRA